jgi:Peptidase S46
MKNQTLFISLFFSFFIATTLHAGEGMWLPILLSQLNEAEMKAMGMKMSAEDIYSINHGSLKDAIVQFNGGCTGEIISDQGLLLTNHHCGYDAIQDHTTLEHNYLENGFWAYSLKEELPNPNLVATFIVRMEDITTTALKGVTDEMAEKDRISTIDKNLASLRKNPPCEAWQEILIRPIFEGNQYYLFVTETYKDVRLVGAPPSAIGKFGSDTDNWVWPRHTGDFSMFRIYADKNNRPAGYSPDNVPYKPKHALPISMDGVAEGDFTMVMGFPGRTQEYLPSTAVAQTLNVLNPIRIGIRDKALKIIDVDMRADAQTKIQYASKYARVANYWKKWMGESQGLKISHGVERKQGLEADFEKKVATNPDFQAKYGTIIPEFNKLYSATEPYTFARENFNETFRNTDILGLISNLNGLVSSYQKNGDKGLDERKPAVNEFVTTFFKDFRPETDKKVFAALMEMYMTSSKAEVIASEMTKQLGKAKQNYTQLANRLYSKSSITDLQKLTKLLEKSPKDLVEALQKDPAFAFGKSMIDQYLAVVDPQLTTLQPQINRLQRKYMQAQIAVLGNEKRFYPDANSTLRVTYGNVKSYSPKDGLLYTHYTYLDGVMEKYVPGDYEFDVPQKLRDLYAKKDFGPYAAENGKMPVCFIGSNHTTGGNSGSPALDASGNLIGLNFDRVWEGTMSDINYDPSICRNIMVDARYLLFIIDKYAGAKNLINELKLVHPKK